MNFTSYIFAGEVPPNEMYKLLTNEWKIKSEMAILLIDVYGGHILDVYRALLYSKNQEMAELVQTNQKLIEENKKLKEKR